MNHHQFESIHPFYDDNGRTGRIINILSKNEYYRLLQAVRTHQAWEEWILYILEGVEQTSHQTTFLIQEMKELMQQFKHEIRNKLPKIYSQDLLNNLFRHPYTKIDFVMQELQVHRNTAMKYLEELVRIGLLKKHKIAKENFYINSALFDLFCKTGR